METYKLSPEMEAAAARFNITRENALELYPLCRPIPWLYVSLLLLWVFCTLSWSIDTWRTRRSQTSYLQLMLASVPLFEVLQLLHLVIFWCSCYHFQICTVWTFGVYGTGMLFQTASFVAFMLISHDCYLMYLRIKASEYLWFQMFLLYVNLGGLKIGVPYFEVFLFLSCGLTFYAFLDRIWMKFCLHNRPGSTENQGIHAIPDEKYTTLKKFWGAMLIGSLVEVPVDRLVAKMPVNLLFHLLVREGVQFCILLYIGWIFTTRGAPDVSVTRTSVQGAPEGVGAAVLAGLESQESHDAEQVLPHAARC